MNNKKGFTLIELLAIIVVLSIVSGLAIYSMSGVIGNSKKKVYENFEDTLKGAVQEYLVDNPNEIPNKNSTKTIYAKDLKKYLDNLNSPDGGDCNNTTNNSYVIVTRGSDISNNFDLSYKSCLICVDKDSNQVYKSDGC